MLTSGSLRQLAALAALGAASLGMGGLGGTRPGRIPTPPRNFTAEVADRAGVVTRASQVSCGGEIFLIGKRGDTTVAVSFDKLRRVRFAPAGEKQVEATVELTSGGEPLRLRVDRGLTCAGATDFGTVQVEAGDLSTITFLGEARPEPGPAGGAGQAPRPRR